MYTGLRKILCLHKILLQPHFWEEVFFVMLHRQKFAQNFVTTPFLGGSCFLLNDGAKRNRLLYLKIMYTAIKKILYLQVFL